MNFLRRGGLTARRPWAALLLALLPVFGARADQVEVLGFSPTGDSVAVLEHGVGAGSGVPWARLTDYLARTGKPARPQISVGSGGADHGAPAFSSEDAAVAEAKRLGELQRGELQTGQLVPGVELKRDGNELRAPDGRPLGALDLTARSSRTRRSAVQARETQCPAPYMPQRLRLVLRPAGGGKSTLLLNEKRTPGARPCSNRCAAGRAFALKTTAVVLISCGVPGFEGSSTTTFPVVAKLPESLQP